VLRRGLPSLGSLLLLALLLYAGLGGCDTEAPDSGPPRTEPSAPITAPVTDVVDGDTIEVEIDGEIEDVRYIGVDTPESVAPDQPVECFGPDAAELNARLVEGERVRLVPDAEPRDVYGRLLAYVHVTGGGSKDVFVNAELLRRGYARTLTIEPNDRFASFFDRLEQTAANAGRGLWGEC
jgi:micrococcal nuclease